MWVMHVEKPECCNNLGYAEESGGGCPKYRKEIFLCVEFSASGHLAKELGNMGVFYSQLWNKWAGKSWLPYYSISLCQSADFHCVPLKYLLFPYVRIRNGFYTPDASKKALRLMCLKLYSNAYMKLLIVWLHIHSLYMYIQVLKSFNQK